MPPGSPPTSGTSTRPAPSHATDEAALCRPRLHTQYRPAVAKVRQTTQPILDETISAEELQEARSKAWGKYAGYTDAHGKHVPGVIDTAKRHAFRQAFDTASDHYNTTYMAPLAMAHAAWMASAAMASVFEHHFDPKDINTGVGFTAVFAACIVGTAGYGASQQLYSTWLQQGMAAKNLLWNALLYNSPELAGKAEAVKEEGGEPPKVEMWKGLFEVFAKVAGHLRLAGEHAVKTLQAQSAVDTLIGELGSTFVDTLSQRGAAGQNLMAVLGMHAGMPVQRVEITGSRREVFQQAYKNLEALQPAAMAGDALARAQALDERMRVLEAEMRQAGVSMDDKVRSWSLLLDATSAEPHALANLTPETQSAIAAERLKLISPAPGNIAVPIPVDDYAGKVLRFLKSPGFIAPVAAVFAVMGWRSALADERKALKDEQGRAIATLVAAYAGLTASAFEVIKASVEGAAERKLPLLGPMAEALSGRFLRFVEVGGAGAGTLGMLIATVVDLFNTVDALKEGEAGMAALYFARSLPEAGLGISAGYSLYTLIVEGAAAELFGGPAVWILTGCIIIVSVIIDIAKDPATLKWAKHCYFGKDPEYVDDSFTEYKDFISAISEH